MAAVSGEQFYVKWTWDDRGGMRRADERSNSTWIKELDFTVRPTWQQLLDLGRGSYNWLMTDSYAQTYCFTQPSTRTGASGSCLVATLCYHVGNGEYKVIQSTIPRGQWLRRMQGLYAYEAPEWCAAATNNGQHAVQAWHAEDSALYFLEQTFNGHCLAPRPGGEGLRIVVYGWKGGSTQVGKRTLCPNCQRIAGRLSMRYLHSNNTIAGLDAEDAQRQQQQQQPPSSSGSGSRYSGDSIWDNATVDPVTGDLIASDGTRLPAQGRSSGDQSRSRPGGATFSSMSLTERMSRLSMDNRGGSRPKDPLTGGPSVRSGGFQGSPPRDAGRDKVSVSSPAPRPVSKDPRQSSTKEPPVKQPSSTSIMITSKDARTSAGRDGPRKSSLQSPAKDSRMSPLAVGRVAASKASSQPAARQPPSQSQAKEFKTLAGRDPRDK